MYYLPKREDVFDHLTIQPLPSRAILPQLMPSKRLRTVIF